MRSMLLVCALALAGCGDDTTTSSSDLATAADLALPPDLTPLHCGTICPPCAATRTCVQSAGGLIPFSPACLATCTSDADCAMGDACVAIDGATPAGRYCLSSTQPQTCGIECDLVPSYSACDGNDVVAPYNHLVCGRSYTHCANGCIEDAPDGGDNRQAHCR